MRLTTTAVMIALTLAAPACLAANANNPYGNINPANDAGNNTGDLQVEALNQAQIDDGPRAATRRAQDYSRYAQLPYGYGRQGPPEPDADEPPEAYYPGQAYAPAQAYPAPPSYQQAEAYPPPGYAPYAPASPYPPAAYGRPAYGPGSYAAPGYYPPRGYYGPPGYYPPPGYAPPPGY